MAESVNEVPDWLIPNRVYDVLKWVGLLVCPALATFMLTLGETWGIPYAPEIATTTAAVGTLVGVVIGASQLKASSGGESDGKEPA